MRREEHLETEELLDYLEARLPATRAEAVRAHLESGCTQCAGQAADYQRVVARLAADRAPGPPESALLQAFALFGERAAVPRTPPVWARLVFDSRRERLPAGVRDFSDSSFRLVFRGEEREISLFCDWRDDCWQISGRVVGAEPPLLGWEPEASGGPGPIQGEADPSGGFCLRDLPPGRYELKLRGGGSDLLLPDVHLPAP